MPPRIFDTTALTGAPQAGPRSVLRVVQVLAALGSHPAGQTLSQLCRSLSVPKTTLFALLRVLENAGYITKPDGAYRIGPEAVALGAILVEGPRRNFPECAKGVLQSLCRQTGETGFLATLTPDRLHCRYVAVVETENWLRFIVEIGSLKPAYATGTGRAMLAYLPAAETMQLTRQFEFQRLTPKTVSSRRAFLASLQEVRKRGLSVVDSGTVAGVVSVAAPIFSADGSVAAALSAGGPTLRFGARMAAIQALVRAGAEEISRILGYRGDWPPG